MKIFKMNKENWHFALLGLLGSTLSGLIVPFFALIYSQIFAVFSEPIEQMERDALVWSAMFLLIGFLNATGFMISVCFLFNFYSILKSLHSLFYIILFL